MPVFNDRDAFNRNERESYWDEQCFLKCFWDEQQNTHIMPRVKLHPNFQVQRECINNKRIFPQGALEI